MQRQQVFKILTILALILLLLIPINMVRQLVYERMSLRDDVILDIAKSSALSQTVTGPLLIIPYSRTSYDSAEKNTTIKKGLFISFPKTLI